MEQKYCDELARLRLERVIELLDESEDLLKEEKYKSANNRSYYAMEKAIKALLALKGVDAATHSGNLKQFNYHYVFHGDGTFTPDDYQIVAAAEQIRNLSDYDDFYIASKESAVKQVENARKLVEKIRHATESLLC